MNVIAKTRKSHQWNEDRFIIGNSFYVVIDGATPLYKDGNINLACWMVSYLKKNINRYQGSILSRMRKLAVDAYNELGIDKDDPAYLPSAGMACLEEDDNYYYASILGDCEVTFRMKNGEIKRCYTDDLTKLDQISINKLVSAAKEHNIHIAEARPYIINTLIEHRKLMNTKNGYNVFTILPNSNYEEKVFKVNKEDVEEIYLYSDGFSQAFEYLNIYQNHSEMFKKSLDIDMEIKQIVDESFKDPHCDLHPRFKKIDDITVIKLTK